MANSIVDCLGVSVDWNQLDELIDASQEHNCTVADLLDCKQATVAGIVQSKQAPVFYPPEPPSNY